ncbi:MAG: cytochrome P450 [Actinomycetota bacterium]|jgi:cytochrome P450|nr:cytochrome P450 [Actinomycetota bacterium]
MLADLRWDPFDDSLKADPHPLWRRLRDEQPVYWNEQYGFWALSRYADVDAGLRDPSTFSSAHGTVLELMTDDPQTGPLMIFLDPPDHTWLRRLVSRAFTPRRVAELEVAIRDLCRSLLDSKAGQSTFDVVSDYGAIVPAEVIATLLGVPPQDRHDVRELIDASFHLEPGVGMANDVAGAAWGALSDYLTTQLESRRSTPRDDMLTDLLNAEYVDDDGCTHRLGVSESAIFALLLVSAGTETVARLIGWAAALLARHPGQREAVAADRTLLAGAVEEVLRYESPSPVQARWTTTDVVCHGTTIPAGSKVLLLNGSANRDERKFPDADRFDVRRKTDVHLAFGYGVHFCLGAALARLEGRIAVEELVARHPHFQVDDRCTVLLSTSTVRGYEHLVLRV